MTNAERERHYIAASLSCVLHDIKIARSCCTYHFLNSSNMVSKVFASRFGKLAEELDRLYLDVSHHYDQF